MGGGGAEIVQKVGINRTKVDGWGEPSGRESDGRVVGGIPVVLIGPISNRDRVGVPYIMPALQLAIGSDERLSTPLSLSVCVCRWWAVSILQQKSFSDQSL